MKKLNAKGFTAVEGLLALILLAIVSFTGYYVYHAQHNTNKSLDAANKSAAAQSTATASSTKTSKAADTTSAAKYLDVKEWGVKFPYSGSDTLSYHFTSNDTSGAAIASASLATAYPGCAASGAGEIGRGHADDAFNDAGQTFAQAYAAGPSAMGKIGDYYYGFQHDSGECATNRTDASAAAQETANGFVKAIVPKVVTP